MWKKCNFRLQDCKKYVFLKISLNNLFYPRVLLDVKQVFDDKMNYTFLFCHFFSQAYLSAFWRVHIPPRKKTSGENTFFVLQKKKKRILFEKGIKSHAQKTLFLPSREMGDCCYYYCAFSSLIPGFLPQEKEDFFFSKATVMIHAQDV